MEVFGPRTQDFIEDLGEGVDLEVKLALGKNGRADLPREFCFGGSPDTEKVLKV